MDAIEHLAETTWEQPEDYGGFSPVGDYVILGWHRDSDLLEQSNWTCACKALGAVDHDSGEFDSRPPVYTFRAGHWAVGWIEYLMVRSDAPEATLKEAGEIICSLADYSILNEEHHSELAWEAKCKAWEQASVADRVHYLQRAHQNIFAARRDEIPEDDNGSLGDALLGY